MERGDVVRVDLPPPLGVAGGEQIGERPAVILQVKLAANLDTVLVVPCTSKLHNSRHFGAVQVAASALNGLDVESVFLVHQLRAIDRRRIRRVVGRLAADDLARIESRVRDILGL
jgi:mRNA interferase MazF